MIEQSEGIGELSKALVAAQADFPPINKNKTAKVKMKSGGEYSYKYADFGDVIESVRPVLAKHRLALVQFTCSVNGKPGLATRVLHESGEWMQATTEIVGNTTAAQEFGSALTYMRRYAGTSALGIVTDEDDDGKAAGRRTPQQPEVRVPNPVRVPPDVRVPEVAMPSGATISDAQVQRLWVIARANRIPDEQVRAVVQIIAGVESSKAIPKAKYEEVIAALSVGQEAS